MVSIVVYINYNINRITKSSFLLQRYNLKALKTYNYTSILPFIFLSFYKIMIRFIITNLYRNIRYIVCWSDSFVDCSIDILQLLLLLRFRLLRMLLDFYRLLAFRWSYYWLKYLFAFASRYKLWLYHLFEKQPHKCLWSLLSLKDGQGSWFNHERYGKLSLLHKRQIYYLYFFKCS